MSAEFSHNRGSTAPARSRPSIIANAIKGLQVAAKLSPDDWRRRLATVGLAPEELEDSEALLPLEKGFAAFAAAAQWTGDPRLCLAYATAFSVGGSGPLGFATVNAKSVREAMRTLSRFVPLVTTTSLIRFDEDDAGGSIVWRYPGQPAAPRGQLVMWGTALSMERLAPALPPGWKPHTVEFEFDEPSDRSAFDDYFGPGLRFGRPINRLCVQAELLDRPPPGADARLFEVMTRLGDFERERRGVYSSQFEADARGNIPKLLANGQASIGDLALAMGVSVQTLRKSFKEHQLDFRTLVDDVRKEKAQDYLLGTDISITEIAFALGYADSSIFTRACHKWFDKAPRDVRAGALL